jgi:nicotinamidase-related amidase
MTPKEGMGDGEKTTTISQPTSPTRQAKEPKPYDELKIKDGPIYNWVGANESRGDDNNVPSSNDSMLSEDSSNASSPMSYSPSPLRAESTALLIVDVQPEYWSNCPAVRKDFPDFPKHLQKTIEICRQRRAKIIWVRADYRHQHSPWLTQFERIRGPRNLIEVPCDPSSPEFTWEEYATPEGGEVIIAKSSWSSTNNTALVDILKAACIETVLVCGLITSVCVQHSAFGIFEAGYRTLLVTDACADRGKARHEAALALYGDYMYELVTSEDLESKTMGLIPAQPVWLVLDQKTNMVRANSFPKQPTMTTSTSSATVSTTSSNTSSISSSSASAAIREGDGYKTGNKCINNQENSSRPASDAVDNMVPFLMIPEQQ